MKTIILSIINRIKKIVYLASPQGEWVAYSAPPSHGDTEATGVSQGKKKEQQLINHGDTEATKVSQRA